MTAADFDRRVASEMQALLNAVPDKSLPPARLRYHRGSIMRSKMLALPPDDPQAEVLYAVMERLGLVEAG